MADGYCDWGETPHPRNVIITTLNPPSTIELCDEHQAVGMIPLLAANLGVDPGKFYDAVKRFTDKWEKDIAKELADAEKAEQEPCKHEHISWHGSRSECQDCGEIVVRDDFNYDDPGPDGAA